ncbi:hypothetical protein M3Y99_01391200 [Aphelenchoides fujianensis]|nr:hypothetical protein M3Y99_01391200 [Aphelenchoides fujianensis]
MTLVEDKPLSKPEEERRVRTTLKLWRTRDDRRPFPPARFLQLNQEIAYRALTCRNDTRWLPATYRDLWSIDHVCNEEGTGTKNVVVFGNSHAFVPFFAIAHAFRPLAARISLVATGACTPLSAWSTLEPKKAERCGRFIRKGIELMNAWHEPIDIAIVLFGFVDYGLKQDLPLADPLEEDLMLSELQTFYSAVSNATREAVLIGDVNLLWDQNPLRTIQQAVLAKKEVGSIRETKEKQLAHLPNIRKRMQMIDCPRCQVVDWLDLWCSAKWCDALDRRKLSFFMDTHHPTSFGSMFVADRLLRTYENITRTRG